MDADHPKIGKSAIVRGIKSVTIHENYQAYTYDNDIAIIEMDQPVIIGDAIRTACLPEDSKLFIYEIQVHKFEKKSHVMLQLKYVLILKENLIPYISA